MLATLPDRRGERLALVLGAHVLIGMAERFGSKRFFTGVEVSNGASEAVCARMGFAPEGRLILSVADPGALGSGRMTK